MNFKVAILIDKPVPYERPTGMGVAAFNLSRELAKLGVQIFLICRGEREASGVINDNFHIYMIRNYTRDSPKTTMSLYKRERFNILHTHSSSTIPTFLAMKALHLPVLVHMHGVETRYPLKKEVIYRMMFKLADKLLSVSEDVKDGIIKKFRVPEEKIETVYNGVDIKVFKPLRLSSELKEKYRLESFSHILLSIGMLQQRKGQHYIIQSLPYILENHPETCYINIGGAYSKDHVLKLESLVKRLGLTEHVRFLEGLTTDELVQFINLAEICVHPALREGFGLAVVEEMACAKPVVAFNRCSMPEIIDHMKNGILVETGNIKELASAINKILDNKEFAKALGKQARKKVTKEFTWTISAHKLLTIYRNVQACNR